MRPLVWLIRAFIFFTLFAFALNNQQAATVRWFFGVQWQAPMVIIVLAAFAVGAAMGVIAMLPDAWRRWRQVKRLAPPPAAAPAQPAATSVLPSEFGAEQPPRMGP
jgi:lipopolysaccharide assembly protein A